MELRISNIRIQNFRGIPNTLTLDLRPENTDVPSSLILAGDNGTGKSSLVDAFEFALQGQIARKRVFLNVPNLAVVSLLSNNRCEVEVTFTDGSVQKRAIYKKTDGHWQTYKQPHPRFAISPFVLRRADILSFWNTPEHERQLIFLDYFRNPTGEWTETQKEEFEKLKQRRIKLKDERRNLAKQLAEYLKIESHEIKLDEHNFNLFARDRIYGGMSYRKRKELERQGVNIKIDPLADRLVKDLRRLTTRIAQLNKKTNHFLNVKKGPLTSKELMHKLHEVLESAAMRITGAFCRVSPSRTFVERIEIVQGGLTKVTLSLNVHLKNGRVSLPQKFFSEANLDLLALLVFLAFAKESAQRGQAKFLILDDVLQSVDSAIRVFVAEYILEEFSNWQLIFTVHDRLWQEQLRELFRRNNHPFVEREIVRWEFENGPIIINAGREIDLLLKDALGQGETVTICSQAGLLIERICTILSYTLPIPVTRRKGDKYTLGDLWPGIHKVLRNTSSKSTAEEVNRWLYLRNLVGAHYNEWAQTLSRQEAQFFGDSVLKLLSETRCSNCFYWIEGRGNAWSCRCGKTRVAKV